MDILNKVWATEVTWAEGAFKRRDSEVINRPNWYQVTTPSRPIVVYNGMYRSIMDDSDADQIIDEVFESYRARKLPFRWTVGPSARPTDLAERLRRRGMVLFAKTVGMVIPATTEMPPTHPDITVEQVTSETILDWARASASGWGMPEDYISSYAQDMRDQIEMGGGDIAFVLAHYKGEAAGAGTLQLIHGIGWLKGTSVRPEFRGRGVYQALVSWRLAAMRKRGVEWGAIQATVGTAEPVCRRLGFEEVCSIDVYRSPEQ